MGVTDDCGWFGMEKVVKLTVMLTEQQAENLSLAQQQTGADCSKIVRFCIDHSLPVAVRYHPLIYIVPTLPDNGHQKKI